jgi:hypothetical protein
MKMITKNRTEKRIYIKKKKMNLSIENDQESDRDKCSKKNCEISGE